MRKQRRNPWPSGRRGTGLEAGSRGASLTFRGMESKDRPPFLGRTLPAGRFWEVVRMSVKLRLTRAGAKKSPFYHVIATDERAKRDGKYIEQLGSYDPRKNPAIVQLNQ